MTNNMMQLSNNTEIDIVPVHEELRQSILFRWNGTVEDLKMFLRMREGLVTAWTFDNGGENEVERYVHTKSGHRLAVLKTDTDLERQVIDACGELL